ncbi:cytochrome D ubiquinol oxidase subunit I [Hylemonella gracilis str. Niagara R]|uniref:Cytochrome D ubiquinol oxidase subunit I n=1 Tax=Hylemonella gracilis str. Niagara R TaxID=1458275 RepID=A0A016XLD1_9BURK|nr:cytochrome ubiquinol oxidase subunit I [Hylemonella gracilis]EYC52003.1 cytochrome D ubiquinol oxidase subunit I [Hylemonella gracilis str. Niagara R]
MDALLAARIQFAANISFHILFPTITIALCWLLLFFRIRQSLATRREGAESANALAWEQAYYFWTKVFALTFALGVVSGITMSFQFGTNWPGFMERAGNIAGPLLGYEVLTAFFLEATFLGIMLFGRGRVSERTHFIATLLVALGTTLSAFWILALNSWMQTPAGYTLIDGRFHAQDWWAIVFNPSFPYRLGHKLLASALTASFLMAGLSAWQLLRRTATPGTHKALRTAIVTAAVAIPLQIWMGDLHGLNTLAHQPAKIAAIEGIWHTERGAPLTLLGWPSEKEGRTLYAVQIPKGASLILAHDADAELQGLEAFPGQHPPVAPVFWSFRVMVGVGMLMLAVAWLSAWKLYRVGSAGLPRYWLWMLAAMTFSGWVATLAGWYVTEIGRQPWIVYGVLRTADVVADHPTGMVVTTLVAYLLVYALLLLAYVGVLKYMAEHPAPASPTTPSPTPERQPTHPRAQQA